MGVTGLWKLIEPCGQPVPVEMLENKVLAIDISIWLHQVVKGFQDNKGSALANAHLLGLFHRLCKLLYYRIKPVFVFDGKVPLLKIQTIAKRKQSRNKLVKEADRIQDLLLQSLAKEKIVQQALGIRATEELLKSSPTKNRKQSKRPDIDDMFILPELPETEEKIASDDSFDPSCSSQSDSSFNETKPAINTNQNLQAIDVKSKHFLNLPADIRHEILFDIKETRKQSSWGRLHELPSKSNEFSTFQMKRLLKRRLVQQSIEDAEKEMDGVRTLTMSELEQIFSDEGIIEAPALGCTKNISSDGNTRYLLVQDLKETLAKAAAEESRKKEKEQELEEKKTLDDYDLEMALKMSLDDAAPYSESDYELKESVKLNKAQKSQLKNAAVGLARAYMIEHAGMNEEEVKSLLENTQNWDGDELNLTFGLEDKKDIKETAVELEPKKQESSFIESSNDDLQPKTKKEEKSFIESSSDALQHKPTSSNSLIVQNENEEIGIISDSNSESDEDVIEISNTSNNVVTNTISNVVTNKMEIFVDPSKTINKEDDLFADVFKTTEEKQIVPKMPSLNVNEILQNLKKQASEATKINLSDIKLDTSIIEIADDENVPLSPKLDCDINNAKSPLSQSIAVEEIPELLSEEKSLSTTPTRLLKKGDSENVPLETTSKSSEVIEIIESNLSEIRSTHVTPSKTKDISQFFETEYFIKRTPERLKETEDVPKVKSPFFVRKTPKSSNEKNQRKRTTTTDNEDSPVAKSKKVNKMLFEDTLIEDTSSTQKIETTTNSGNYLESAANTLKETNTTEQLEDMVSQIAKEKQTLEKERNRQDRMGMTITEKMNSECMQLLRLFGVPFIVAPMEAEAQCAFLDAIELTNGTITDDSDIWLFGGRTVYKNFFAQNKHVMEFKHDKIHKSFNVDRSKLIQLALLVGSDYTAGINGIGTVTALEILATFTTKNLTETVNSSQTNTALTSLRNFREWWASTNIVIGSSLKHRLRKKLRNIEMIEGFPSLEVIEAYFKPKVDESQETFSWCAPDVESIREFARTNFGWTRIKTDETLAPVLKKINEKKSQSTITNYFAVKAGDSFAKPMAVSKRVQTAINSMSTNFRTEEEIDQPKKKTQRKKKINPEAANTDEVLPKKCARVTKKKVNLPKSQLTETIPQRQKDQEEMEQKKKIAAQTLKQSKNAKK